MLRLEIMFYSDSSSVFIVMFSTTQVDLSNSKDKIISKHGVDEPKKFSIGVLGPEVAVSASNMLDQRNDLEGYRAFRVAYTVDVFRLSR